jgi:hypothetical protein
LTLVVVLYSAAAVALVLARGIPDFVRAMDNGLPFGDPCV